MDAKTSDPAGRTDAPPAGSLFLHFFATDFGYTCSRCHTFI